MPNQTPGTTASHPEPIGMQWLITVEKRGSEVEYQFDKNMDCLPKQLMVSFYGVFSQYWLSGLPLGLPCALRIDTSQSWGQYEFSSTSSVEVQLILFLKLGMVADNL